MAIRRLQWTVDIPAEIRLMVYENYFESLTIYAHSPACSYKQGNCATGHFWKHQKERAEAEPTYAASNLLLTCKLVHAEAEHVLFNRARFAPMACFSTLRSSRSTPLTLSIVAQRALQEWQIFEPFLEACDEGTTGNTSRLPVSGPKASPSLSSPLP